MQIVSISDSKTPPDNFEKLSKHKMVVAECLAEGKQQGEAAKKAKIHRCTIGRWQNPNHELYDPLFVRYLDFLRRLIIRDSIRKAAAVSPKLIDKVVEIANAGKSKKSKALGIKAKDVINAVGLLLKHANSTDVVAVERAENDRQASINFYQGVIDSGASVKDKMDARKQIDLIMGHVKSIDSSEDSAQELAKKIREHNKQVAEQGAPPGPPDEGEETETETDENAE